MSSIYGPGTGGFKNPPDTPFGYYAHSIPIPRDFLVEKVRVVHLMGLFPFHPRKIFSIPEDYTTHTAPMLWGPYHQQSKNHRNRPCFTCGSHFAKYPEEDKFFEEMGHEHYRYHNFRKYRFHRMTYIYVIYHNAGFDIQNRVVRADIMNNIHRNSTSKSRMGFKALENNPYFGGLRKMYNDELIRRMGHDPEKIEEAVFNRALDMAIPDYAGKEEIMKTDTGKRAALATLAYMALPEVHTAIQEGELTKQRIRLEDGDKAIELPIGYTPPSLPSDSEERSDEPTRLDL